MAAKKRSLLEILNEGGKEELSPHQNIHRRRRLSRLTPALQPIGDDNDDDSEGIDPADLPEFIPVELEDVRQNFQCAICLGILKKTCAMMNCMHRFCTECIEKSMRMGKKKECPTCRVRCASRRDLRDDPNYDKLVSILFRDVEKYEEQELFNSEEARTLNMQVQASIAQIKKSQSEAVKRGEERRGTEGLSWGGARARSKRKKKECPTCRVRCASRRDLRDDPNYDKLVSILFPDVEKCEEQELFISEEARIMNMQVQASIAQIKKSQSEAVKRGEERRGIEGLSWGGARARSKNRYPKQFSGRNIDLNK